VSGVASPPRSSRDFRGREAQNCTGALLHLFYSSEHRWPLMAERIRNLLKSIWGLVGTLRLEHWFSIAILVGFGSLLAACISGSIHLYVVNQDGTNRLYLLSTISETLGSILALVITATLVATQLATQGFSPEVVRFRLRDPWLWCAIGIYLLAILCSLAAIARSVWVQADWAWDLSSVDLTLLLSGAALVFLVPFTLAILRSFETVSFIGDLLSNSRYGALEDLMRKAVNEGLVRQLETAKSMLQEHAISILARSGGSVTEARQFAELGVRLGRYAAAEKDPEATIVAIEYLTDMTIHCTHRVHRAAADIFNDAVVALQRTAEEAFGGPAQ